jgi:hypothetical protein
MYACKSRNSGATPLSVDSKEAATMPDGGHATGQQNRQKPQHAASTERPHTLMTHSQSATERLPEQTQPRPMEQQRLTLSSTL